MTEMVESLVAPHRARRMLVVAIGNGERPPRDIGTAVYVIVGITGDVLYVGSTCRPEAAGVCQRLAEHLRDPAKQARWNTALVFPLVADTSAAAVRRYEGTVARWLLPDEGRRWPSAG